MLHWASTAKVLRPLAFDAGVLPDCGDRRRRGADPRHGLRAEQDRPAAHVVGDRQTGPRPAAALAVGVGDEQVLAGLHAFEHAAQGPGRIVSDERRSDVGAVEREHHLVHRHVLGHPHLDQRVAVADQVGAIGQRVDLEVEGRQLRSSARGRRGRRRRAGADLTEPGDEHRCEQHSADPSRNGHVPHDGHPSCMAVDVECQQASHPPASTPP